MKEKVKKIIINEGASVSEVYDVWQWGHGQAPVCEWRTESGNKWYGSLCSYG